MSHGHGSVSPQRPQRLGSYLLTRIPNSSIQIKDSKGISKHVNWRLGRKRERASVENVEKRGINWGTQKRNDIAGRSQRHMINAIMRASMNISTRRPYVSIYQSSLHTFRLEPIFSSVGPQCPVSRVRSVSERWNKPSPVAIQGNLQAYPSSNRILHWLTKAPLPTRLAEASSKPYSHSVNWRLVSR